MIPRRIMLLLCENLVRRTLLLLLTKPPPQPPHIQIIRTRRSALHRLGVPIPRPTHPRIPIPIAIRNPTRTSRKRTSSRRVLIPIPNPMSSLRRRRLMIPQSGLRVPLSLRGVYAPLLLAPLSLLTLPLSPLNRQTNIPLLKRRTSKRIKIQVLRDRRPPPFVVCVSCYQRCWDVWLRLGLGGVGGRGRSMRRRMRYAISRRGTNRHLFNKTL